jgi:hypothetical protein
MDAQAATACLFTAGLAFLAGSVWYNRYTGWTPPPRRNDLSNYIRWCAELKSSLAPEEKPADVSISVVPDSPAALAAFSSSLTALGSSLGHAAVKEEAKPVPAGER